MKPRYHIFICCLVLPLQAFAFWPQPQLEVEASLQGSQIVFEFEKKKINGFLDMAIWDAEKNELIWYVGMNYFNGNQIRIGEIPKSFKTFNGGINSARQYFPEEELTLDPKKYGNLIVNISVQYDSIAGASMDNYYYSLEDKDGTIILKELDHLPKDSDAVLEEMGKHKEAYLDRQRKDRK